MGYTLDQSQGTISFYSIWGVTTNPKIAQSFTPSVSGSLSKMTFYLGYDDTTPTDSVKMELYSESGTQPGTLISTASNTWFANYKGTIGTADFIFNSMPSLTTETKYWAVLSRGTLGTSTYYQVGNYIAESGSESYTRGEMLSYLAGTGWGYNEGTFPQDMAFYEYYYTPSQTMRVSLPGYNAGTDTNLDHYALYADTDNVLIKEKSRGTLNVAPYTNGTVAHNLGYPPFYAVYSKNASNQNNWVYGIGIYNLTKTWSNGTNIILRNSSDGTVTFFYYIFYDQQV